MPYISSIRYTSLCLLQWKENGDQYLKAGKKKRGLSDLRQKSTTNKTVETTSAKITEKAVEFFS